MTAKEIMTTEVITVSMSTSIKEAIKLMVEIEISGLIVADENRQLIGVITEKDLLVAYDLLKETKAAITNYVNKHVISVGEDTPVTEISRILVQENIRRVPVLSGRTVVGVVSRRDILKYILKKNKASSEP